MDNAIIFGAGQIGAAAAHYYKNKYNIIGYVDNNSDKWGTVHEKYKVYSPQFISQHENDTVIIVAMTHGEESVKEQLFDMGIDDCIVFCPYSKTFFKDYNYIRDYNESNCLVVSFISGLGNQMFQYALYRYLEVHDKNVLMDLSYYAYHKDRKFLLNKVFKNISINHCNYDSLQKECVESSNRYIEPNSRLGIYEYDYEKIKKMTQGMIVGYHQNYKWAGSIKSVLLEDFIFDDSLLSNHDRDVFTSILTDSCTSVHIRRGDYLDVAEFDTFGNICTIEYYQKAIDYISGRCPSTKFCFISNDIDWVKENINIPCAIYVEESLFEEYEDWYDLYIMSRCCNNIIANSSFSWWGAWLNRNNDKIVIAPKKWINQCDLPDVCPPEWIRL